MGSSISLPDPSSFNFQPFAKRKRIADATSSSSDDDDHMATKCKRMKHIQQPSRYDVFLSFRGDDTRKTFTSHLYRALKRNCFEIFHDTMLARSEAISSQLNEAIQDSRLSVIIFSANYADSRWCLDEVVKILKCRKLNQQIVLPVFLDVEPSDVRKQQGSYKKAFADHQANFDQKRVQKWRRALRKAGEFSGLCLQDDANGDEGKFIDLIINQVAKLSNRPDLHVADHPVGIESRVQELISLLNLESGDVSFTAIWGGGGIGKTTIAKAIYNCLAPKFESHSFLVDVKGIFGQSNGPITLQNKLIFDLVQCDGNQKIDNYHHGIVKIQKMVNYRKVLLVLDDVDNVEQLNILAIDRKFFHPGSRVIVTTRYLSSVSSLDPIVYQPEMLNESESLELFSKHAFGEVYPKEVYEELSGEVVRRAAGLPLVLRIWGAHLNYFKSIEHWQSALKKLIKIPHHDIQGKLKISFDSLDDRQQKLFLDIACFFVGMDKDLVVKVLEDECSGCFSDSEIEILASRCLVRIDEFHKITMHDMVRDMGREIVRQEYVEEPGKRSRLWHPEDVLSVLRDSSGTEAIESITLHLRDSDKQHVHVDVFKKMNKLRFIRFDNLQLYGTLSTYFYSFRKLKYLQWHGFPLKFMPSNLCLGNLVALDLQYSKLEQMWVGIKGLHKLRFLNVSHSYYLTRSPDFSGLENLEELQFEDCTNLEELHSSIGCLDKLLVMNLRNCKALKKVPIEKIFKLKSLRSLDLFGCSNIGYDMQIYAMQFSMRESCITQLTLANCNLLYVPSEFRSLMSLEELDMRGNKFSSFPGGLDNLHQLQKLDLSSCAELQSFPDLPRNLSSITARDCTSLTSLPSNMSDLKSLEKVVLDGCSKLGSADSECVLKFAGLSNLKLLNMNNCNLSLVPSEIGSLVSLETLYLSGNAFCSLPASLRSLLELQSLELNHCAWLKSIPLLPSNLDTIEATNCGSLDEIPFAPVNKVDFSHCPESLCNFYAHDFRRYILQLYQDRSCIKDIHVCVSATKLPDWCTYKCRGNKLSFVPPLHVDRKVHGLIFCAIASPCKKGDDPRRFEPRVLNETNGMSHKFGYCFSSTGTLHLIFSPLNDSKLVVEKGDAVVVEFELTSNHQSCRGVIECGLSLIYEGDEMVLESNHHQQMIEYTPDWHQLSG